MTQEIHNFNTIFTSISYRLNSKQFIVNSHIRMIFTAFAKCCANVCEVLSEFTLEFALAIARISVNIELHVSMYHVYVCRKGVAFFGSTSGVPNGERQ